MQEIKKTRIVLASILKPLDDTRMVEKMGMSLLALGNDVEVHCIGFPSVEQTRITKGINLHPLPRFKRLSLLRLIAPLKIVGLLIRLKPSLIIINTHELLLAAVLAKAITRSRIVYDVRENYFRNILFTNAFPSLLRPLLATYVRLKEIVTSFFIDHFFLAERAYEQELNFPGDRKTIIENKVKLQHPIASTRVKPPTAPALLFSGTLAESTGVLTAIHIATALHQLNPAVSLTIIGYAAQTSFLEKIRKAIQDKPFITLIGGDTLVPHPTILQAIQSADAGIVAYTINPSTENSTPTKVYEYFGHQLPIILINHKPWVDLCEPYCAAIPFDANNIMPHSILDALRHQSFYEKTPENITWDGEEIKFLTVVKSLL
ncbi:MAG: glycosyltransferase [Cyclobacteriaceae bacterium]|nr:glycosyltransferase [Cyclobacteriaceae bacterium]